MKKKLVPDLLAGLTGAVAGAPQAMGFALIAGISPIYGLYTAVIATIVAALTGASTYMTVGPTNALALVVGSTLLNYDTAMHLDVLIVLTLLVGVFQLLFGLLHLGTMTRFVSDAVMTGFITGAGLLIILGQLDHLTGYETQGNSVIGRFSDWLFHLSLLHPQTLVTGLVAMVIIYTLHHTRFRGIATLVAIVLTSIGVAVLGWDEVALVRDMAAIPHGLPDLIVPNFDLMSALLIPALAMAVLASVQSAAITQTVTEPDGSIPSMNRDFAGQGLANIFGAFFQGMPAGGSLSRTAVNVSAGAKTRLANVFAGVFVALILLALGMFIERVTLAALAAHLIVAAVSLLRPERMRVVWNVSISARIAMTTTFVSTLVLPLEYSIYLGIFFSLALYIWTSSQNIAVVRLVPIEDNRYQEVGLPSRLPDGEPVIIAVYGHLYFAAVRRLEYLLPPPHDTQRPVVILRLRHNFYLGSTGIRALRRYAALLRQSGGKLILAGIGETVHEQLRRTGALQDFGTDNIFYADEIVFSATERAVQSAQHWLQNGG